MSRIGKQPIPLPAGVSVSADASTVRVKGPKGQLEHFLPAHVTLAVESDRVLVAREGDHRQARSNHGLTRALVRNMVQGVSQGFGRKLELMGVGFRAEIRGPKLVLNIGYSHPVEYDIPKGVSMAVEKATAARASAGVTAVITLSSIDKQQVGQVAADIRAFRKPDSYKGKGLRYEGEYVRLKAGKSAK